MLALRNQQRDEVRCRHGYANTGCELSTDAAASEIGSRNKQSDVERQGGVRGLVNSRQERAARCYRIKISRVSKNQVVFHKGSMPQ